MSTSLNSNLTMHDVRRLAPASIDVVRRNAGKPAIAAYIPTMVPMASEVLAAIQDLDTLKTDQVALIGRSDEQTAVLNGLMLSWSGRLVRDVEGFDIGAYTRNASLTFDVTQKANSLKQLVEQKGAELPYRETLLAELTARDRQREQCGRRGARGAGGAAGEAASGARAGGQLLPRAGQPAAHGARGPGVEPLRLPAAAGAGPGSGGTCVGRASETKPSETQSDASGPSSDS